MASKTLRRAEKRALDGANESQDTLLVAHYLMMDYGVGLRSSSPAPGETIPLLSPKRSMPPSERSSRNNWVRSDNPAEVNEARGTRVADNSEQSQHSSIPETQGVGIQGGERPADILANWDADVTHEDGALGDLNLPETLPASAEADCTSRRRKMDSTQASTQSNAGRSYDQYRRQTSPGRTSPNPRSSGSPKPIGTSSPGRGTLDDDDIGVRFDFANIGGANKTVPPGQDDSGFVNFDNPALFRHVTSHETAKSSTQHLPETPTPPQNPFRHDRSMLLPTSQLFRGTQFSSPIKLASPTSSRPSPADFPGNSISPNPVISSPLKARSGLRSSPAVDITSSPEVLPGTTSSRLNDRAGSPANTASTTTPVVPESSHNGPTRKRTGPEPMATYEPMRQSQERRVTSEVRSDPASSAEDDDQIVRRRKAKSKKEAALQQLNAIRFTRPPKPDDVEVPATSQRKRTSQAEAHIAQCCGKESTVDDSEGPDGVKEFQERHLPPVQDRLVEDDESTQSDVEGEVALTAEPTPSIVPELPRSSTVSTTQPVPEMGTDGTSNGDAIPETSPTSAWPEHLPGVAPSVEPAPSGSKSTPNFQSSPPAFSTRSRKTKNGRGRQRASSSTSSLSNLASTPQLPSSNLPRSTSAASAGSPTESTIVASSSPAVAQTMRRDARGRLPKLKTGSAESLRQSARVTRRGSNSTDELTGSISGTPTFEQSLRVSRLSMSRSASRSGRGAMKPPATQRDQKLFENMAFAISFQSRKPGESNDQYNVRMDFSATLQKRIKQAGGVILENGFDELFEAQSLGSRSSSPTSSAGMEPEINLSPGGRAMGFTALIADGHSRKVKYMQALALGLPCVATRWVTACLDRNELVDWMPYLLCAGQSAFLGDAIRSRSLSPYNASAARLADVISQRAKLLEGSRILAVVKKALEGKKMAYVFLARVLGASLTRVYSVDEARTEMKAAEDAGQPFDWVYVDGKSDEDALFATKPAGGKKRKRMSAGSFVQPPVKRVRTLSDELVIQSLILGRLIEDGEMEG